MKFAAILLLLSFTGCQKQPTDVLKGLGISRSQITHLVFVDVEPPNWKETRMMLSESNTIDSIWKSLEHSKPIRRDPAIHVSVDFTNYIRVDFYSTASQKPAAHLIVLDWDFVTLGSGPPENESLYHYECPGLYSLLETARRTISDQSAPKKTLEPNH